MLPNRGFTTIPPRNAAVRGGLSQVKIRTGVE
jgi:hypothetical protein